MNPVIAKLHEGQLCKDLPDFRPGDTVRINVRLKEGEVSILAGLIDHIDTKTLNGWPGLAKIPVMRYLFAENSTDRQDNEDLIVLVPRIVRMPEWTRANLRGLYSGTETLPAVKRELDVKAPSSNPARQCNASGRDATAGPSIGTQNAL